MRASDPLKAHKWLPDVSATPRMLHWLDRHPEAGHGEDPQLYFSHMLKTGDPYALAREIRKGIDRTAAE